MSKKYPAIRIGPLPVEKINKALGVDLDPGEVWVSQAAHAHIAIDHPDDYPFIIEAIFEIVAAPLYVGQDPKHSADFYIVRAMPPGSPNPHGLVAIGFERNAFGSYNVRTAYSISQATVDTRRQAKRLHVAM